MNKRTAAAGQGISQISPQEPLVCTAIPDAATSRGCLPSRSSATPPVAGAPPGRCSSSFGIAGPPTPGSSCSSTSFSSTPSFSAPPEAQSATVSVMSQTSHSAPAPLRPARPRPTRGRSEGDFPAHVPVRREDRPTLEREAAAVARHCPPPRCRACAVVPQPELGGHDRRAWRQRVQRETKRRAPDLVARSAHFEAVEVVAEAALLPVVAPAAEERQRDVVDRPEHRRLQRCRGRRHEGRSREEHEHEAHASTVAAKPSRVGDRFVPKA
jgi:hypothetical protein